MENLYDNLPAYESLDSDIVFRIYFTKHRKDWIQTQNIKFILGPDSMGVTDLAIKIQRIRSLIFAASFELVYGKDTNPKYHDLDLENIIKLEITHINSLQPANHFLSFKNCVDMLAGRLGRYVINPPPNTIIKPITPSFSPRERFGWILGYQMVGQFLWAPGRSDTFRLWLRNAASDLPANAKINCWEMVFYAAIKAQYMPSNLLLGAYPLDDRALGEQPMEIMNKSLTPYMTPFSAENTAGVKLKSGDIIVVHQYSRGQMNVAGLFQHVMVAGLDTPEIDGKTYLENTVIVQLWGQSRGAGCTYYSTLGASLDDNRKLRDEDYSKQMDTWTNWELNLAEDLENAESWNIDKETILKQWGDKPAKPQPVETFFYVIRF